MSLAAIMAAAGLGVLLLRLCPDLFQPWPAALLILLASGTAGGLFSWAAGGRMYGLPLAVTTLPFIRLILLYFRHGPPPWPFGRRFLLLGDGFPWWAAASIAGALYAGSLSACWVRMALASERIRRGPGHDRPIQAADARRVAGAADRLYVGFFFLAALVLSVIGKRGEERAAPALFCLLVFLAAGIAFTGLMQAGSMTAVWRAEGAAFAAECEESWLAGHRRWLLPLFLLLLVLPWLERPLSLAHLLNLLARLPFRPGAIPERTMTIPRLLQRMPAPHLPGLLRGVLLGCLFVLYTAALLLAAAVAAILCFLALRRLFFLVRGWFAGLPSFMRAVRDFLAALLCFFRRTAAAGIGFKPFRFGAARARRKALGRSRAFWPPTPVRRLFAKLVLWGRNQGIALPPALAPAEIAQMLSILLPEGGEEDLAFLVEIYRRERYGEERLDRRTRLLYRRVWERIVRRKTAGTAPPEGGGT